MRKSGWTLVINGEGKTGINLILIIKVPSTPILLGWFYHKQNTNHDHGVLPLCLIHSALNHADLVLFVSRVSGLEYRDPTKSDAG